MSKDLFKQIQQNNVKLNGCKKHNFGKYVPVSGALSNVRYLCKNCGGRMKLIDIAAYIRGSEAAGGNSEDILKGFK